MARSKVLEKGIILSKECTVKTTTISHRDHISDRQNGKDFETSQNNSSHDYIPADVSGGSPAHRTDGTDISWDLARLVSNVMDQHEVAISATEKANYLPLEQQIRLVTDLNITRTLGQLPVDFVDWIRNKAPKTFLITIQVFLGRAQRLQAMRTFYSRGFQDQKLPVISGTCECPLRPTGQVSTTDDEPGLSLPVRPKTVHKFPMQCCNEVLWLGPAGDSFFEKQWALLPQSFQNDTFLYPDIDQRRRLPFQSIDLVRASPSGRVYKARILKDFQDSLPAIAGEKTVDVAIKEVRNKAVTRSDTTRGWSNEILVHEALRGRDEHIITAFGAYTYRGTTSLILEWADGGDLQSYWRQNQPPALSASLVQEQLQQFRGLAHALSFLHNISLDVQLSSNIPSKLRQRHTICCHFDIKPQNILIFTNHESGLRTFKITDFGRAKLVSNVKMNPPSRSMEGLHTSGYASPESFTWTRGDVSQLGDVWSLGCVLLEAVIWLVHGNVSHDIVSDLSHNVFDGSGTPSWVRTDATTIVNPRIQQLMDHMVENDSSHSGSASLALKDLVRLVRDKMLVVDLPEDVHEYIPGRRASSHVVLRGMDEILSRSQRPDYLFSETSTSHQRLPTYTPLGVTSSRENDQATAIVKHSSKVFRPSDILLNNSTWPSEDEWQYHDDEDFVRRGYQSQPGSYDQVCQYLPKSSLCEHCENLELPDIGPVITWRKLRELEHTCHLCAMLLACADSKMIPHSTSFSLSRDRTGLVLKWMKRSQIEPQRLRLCRYLKSQKSANPKLSRIPVGLPKLPPVGSQASIEQIKSWLRDCDSGHGHKKLNCTASRSAKRLPKRLVDVGSSASVTSIRVLETAMMPPLDADNLKYLALSHPWGPYSPQNVHFRSTADKIAEHMRGIPDADLPQTFMDAVIVARSLGIRYLWIDALCILQATSTDPGDFSIEARFMENIFSSAFCVISASCATSMHSGFLYSGSSTPREHRQAAEIIFSNLDSPVVVCDSPDDFQRDVLDTHLYSRGWVLPERALARRTLFFTANQIYWECSGGIRCETMSKMANSQVAFMGDSNFPYFFIDQTSDKPQTRLVEKLYADYCDCNFTISTDKPIAIAGLEHRLTQCFEDVSGAGVFGKHKGKFLLWVRRENVAALERIDFSHANSEPHKPPSWSYMAFIGPIEYLDFSDDDIDWQHLDLRLTGTAEISWLYADEPLRFRARLLSFEIRPDSSPHSRLLVYDQEHTATAGASECVIIATARRKAIHYVLLVRSVVHGDAVSLNPTYERVGAGYLPASWIISDSGVDAEIV